MFVNSVHDICSCLDMGVGGVNKPSHMGNGILVFCTSFVVVVIFFCLFGFLVIMIFNPLFMRYLHMIIIYLPSVSPEESVTLPSVRPSVILSVSGTVLNPT